MAQLSQFAEVAHAPASSIAEASTCPGPSWQGLRSRTRPVSPVSPPGEVKTHGGLRAAACR